MGDTSAPLADYFWIAGIDSLSYADPVLSSPLSQITNPPATQVESTIEEGVENGDYSPPGTANPRATARHSRTNSWQRLNKLSNDARASISTLDEDMTKSNRSSMTIKAGNTGTHTNGVTSNGNGNLLGDFDFDQALLKFANERENFLDDLSFSAGASVQKPPPMTSAVTNPRTDRLRIDENESSATNGRRSPLKSVGGSIRRRISFRDMNSVRRQTSTVQRSSKCLF